MSPGADALADRILREAVRFAGLRGVLMSAGLENPRTPERDYALARELRGILRPLPWGEGWSYSAAYCEAVVAAALGRLGFPERKVGRWRRLMTPDCAASASGLAARGLLSDKPGPGAVWLARAASGPGGRAGIVLAASGKSMATVEADEAGPDCGDDRILTRLRPVPGGGRLRTAGFVAPAAVLALLES